MKKKKAVGLPDYLAQLDTLDQDSESRITTFLQSQGIESNEPIVEDSESGLPENELLQPTAPAQQSVEEYSPEALIRTGKIEASVPVMLTNVPVEGSGLRPIESVKPAAGSDPAMYREEQLSEKAVDQVPLKNRNRRSVEKSGESYADKFLSGGDAVDVELYGIKISGRVREFLQILRTYSINRKNPVSYASILERMVNDHLLTYELEVKSIISENEKLRKRKPLFE